MSRSAAMRNCHQVSSVLRSLAGVASSSTASRRLAPTKRTSTGDADQCAKSDFSGPAAAPGRCRTSRRQSSVHTEPAPPSARVTLDQALAAEPAGLRQSAACWPWRRRSVCTPRASACNDTQSGPLRLMRWRHSGCWRPRTSRHRRWRGTGRAGRARSSPWSFWRRVGQQALQTGCDSAPASSPWAKRIAASSSALSYTRGGSTAGQRRVGSSRGGPEQRRRAAEAAAAAALSGPWPAWCRHTAGAAARPGLGLTDGSPSAGPWRALPPLLGHLRLDLVDLLERERAAFGPARRCC